MRTDIYRSTVRPPLDPAEEERELLALGEKTGLFADARQRRRMILGQVVVIAFSIAIMAHWGLDACSLYLIVMAVWTIGAVIAEPAARRRAVQRAIREAPAIEPPRQ